MKQTETLYFKDRNEWRAWLEQNYASRTEVWLVYYKKHTGKTTISYEDAIEEAVCFGWIDGKVMRIDDERFMQRYTPRTAKSPWSESNIDRAKRMIEAGKMTGAGLDAYRDAVNAKRVIPTVNSFSVPSDLKEALAADPKAEANFNKFAPSDQLMYVYWVDSAKREKTRRDRIAKTVERSAKNKKPADM